MPNVRIDWRGGWRFDGLDSKDVPVAIHGEQVHGAKPSDLLPLALAACSATDLVDELGDDLASLHVDARYTQEPAPPWRFQRIRLHYRLAGGALTEERVAEAIRRSEEEKCSVAASLRGNVEITSTFDLATT